MAGTISLGLAMTLVAQSTVAGRVFLKSAFCPWSFLALELSILELESWFFVCRDIFFIRENPRTLQTYSPTKNTLK